MQKKSERSGPPGQRPSLRTFLTTAFSYRKRSGMWAWLLHRTTGLFLVLFLVAHIIGLTSLKDPAAFEIYVTTFRNPLLKIAEVLLLASIAVHGFNGLRIMIQDLFYRSETQRYLFSLVLFVTIAVTLVGGTALLFPYFIAPLLP